MPVAEKVAIPTTSHQFAGIQTKFPKVGILGSHSPDLINPHII